MSFFRVVVCVLAVLVSSCSHLSLLGSRELTDEDVVALELDCLLARELACFLGEREENSLSLLRKKRFIVQYDALLEKLKNAGRELRPAAKETYDIDAAICHARLVVGLDQRGEHRQAAKHLPLVIRRFRENPSHFSHLRIESMEDIRAFVENRKNQKR